MSTSPYLESDRLKSDQLTTWPRALRRIHVHIWKSDRQRSD